jgi:phage baseplate assembly protein W
MGYQITPPPAGTSQLAGLGIGFPLIGPGGSPIYISSEQALQNLKTLLLTKIGERYGRPDYGTNLLNALFEPSVSQLKEVIIELIQPKIAYWLPYINVESITVLTAEDDPNLDYDIQVSIKFSVSNFDTQTLNINANENGTVTVTEAQG